jgi:hypothetical protein
MGQLVVAVPQEMVEFNLGGLHVSLLVGRGLGFEKYPAEGINLPNFVRTAATVLVAVTPGDGCLPSLWQASLSEARDEMAAGFFRLPRVILQHL